MKKSLNALVLEYVVAIFGMMVLAFGIAFILVPNNLLIGGLTGLSLVLQQITSIEYTIVNYALSITILILAYVFLGKKEGHKIVFVAITFPMILFVFDKLKIYLGWQDKLVQNDMILACIFNGIVCGLGVGIILKAGFSSGGTDTVGIILKKKLFPHVSLSYIFATIDGIILFSAALVYDANKALYSIVTQYIFIKSINYIIYGLGNNIVEVEVLTSKHKELKDYILNEMNRGVTTSMVQGGYSGNDKVKVVCICTPRESIKIKQYLAGADENSFATVTQLNLVWGLGTGFSSIHEN